MIYEKDIRPFVRYAQIVTISDKRRFENVLAYDHRLFYVKSGEGKIIIDETEYRAYPSDLFIFSSGVKYSLINDLGKELELIGLSFDLTFTRSEVKSPIPPSGESNFDPELIIEPIKAEDGTPLCCPIIQHKRGDAENELLGIYSEYKSKLKLYEHRLSGKMLAFLIDAIQRNDFSSAEPKNQGVDRVLEVIRTHYSEPLSNHTVGKLTGYHENHINRLMVRYTGMSLHSYLQSYRIERAIELLQGTDLPINEICSMVGFLDFTHFSKYFKKKTGYTPSDFRGGRQKRTDSDGYLPNIV
jgi:AraC-like DNA-binding protein